VDRRLTAYLAAHHGLITTAAALEIGVTHDQLTGHVRRGELERIHHGVYRAATTPPTLDQRIRASLLAVGPGAVVSHRAALELHGVRNFQSALVELTHRSTSLPLRDGVLVHRSSTLRDEDVRTVGGIPTTSPARTLIDSAGVMSPALVSRYAQRWLAERKLTPDGLESTLQAVGQRHRGARSLRAHLGDVIAEADSTEEAKLGRILRRAGIEPELHVLVTTRTGYTFELDWAYPDALLGLEMDGYGIHLRSVAAFDDDRWRRNELEIAGWRILNFTARQCRNQPQRIAEQVRRAIMSTNSA
jgi:very-short-patch-repair endonuclease